MIVINPKEAEAIDQGKCPQCFRALPLVPYGTSMGVIVCDEVCCSEWMSLASHSCPPKPRPQTLCLVVEPSRSRSRIGELMQRNSGWVELASMLGMLAFFGGLFGMVLIMALLLMESQG